MAHLERNELITIYVIQAFYFGVLAIANAIVASKAKNGARMVLIASVFLSLGCVAIVKQTLIDNVIIGQPNIPVYPISFNTGLFQFTSWTSLFGWIAYAFNV